MTLARGSIVDTLLELEDGAAAITATEVNSGGIKDLGAANFHGEVNLQCSAILTSDNDEGYLIELQGSNSATFASGIVVLASLHLGALEVLGDVDADQGVGFYKIPFNNEQAGTTYRYARLKVTLAGGTTESITYTAHISPPVR